MRLFFVILVYITLPFASFAADSVSLDAIVDKAKELGSVMKTDSMGDTLVHFGELTKLLDRPDKFDLISGVWERADSIKEKNDVFNAILYYLVYKENSKSWLDHPLLDAQVSSHLCDEEVGIRSRIYTLFLIACKNPDRLRQIYLAALGDKDDRIRRTAIAGIYKFDNGVKIVEYYISIHANDAAFVKSVNTAKSLLSRVKE